MASSRVISGAHDIRWCPACQSDYREPHGFLVYAWREHTSDKGEGKIPILRQRLSAVSASLSRSVTSRATVLPEPPRFSTWRYTEAKTVGRLVGEISHLGSYRRRSSRQRACTGAIGPHLRRDGSLGPFAGSRSSSDWHRGGDRLIIIRLLRFL